MPHCPNPATIVYFNMRDFMSIQTATQQKKLAASSLNHGHILRQGVTFEEFLHWDGENQHVEWVDGNVIDIGAVNIYHQQTCGFLRSLLYIYVQQRQCGRILGRPFIMKPGTTLPGRAPDIIFIETARLDRIHEYYLEGPADLAIEVVSPDHPKRDYVQKLAEYERGGVLEYWIIDPEEERATFYRLINGKYRGEPLAADGSYHSLAVPQFWLRPAWLWQQPLPNMIDILREWMLI